MIPLAVRRGQRDGEKAKLAKFGSDVLHDCGIPRSIQRNKVHSFITFQLDILPGEKNNRVSCDTRPFLHSSHSTHIITRARLEASRHRASLEWINVHEGTRDVNLHYSLITEIKREGHMYTEADLVICHPH